MPLSTLYVLRKCLACKWHKPNLLRKLFLWKCKNHESDNIWNCWRGMVTHFSVKATFFCKTEAFLFWYLHWCISKWQIVQWKIYIWWVMTSSIWLLTSFAKDKYFKIWANTTWFYRLYPHLFEQVESFWSLNSSESKSHSLTLTKYYREKLLLTQNVSNHRVKFLLLFIIYQRLLLLRESFWQPAYKQYKYKYKLEEPKC